MSLIAENEIVKREYRQYLKSFKGKSELSIKKFDQAIQGYEDAVGNPDFKLFSKEKAEHYHEALKKRTFRGAEISLATQFQYLSEVRVFFLWLCSRNGYRTIDKEAISILRLSIKENRVATQKEYKEYPDLGYCIKLASSIGEENEVDFRDKALVSFLAETGARIDAIISAPLLCIDETKLRFFQNPKNNVRTKFSKNIPSKIFTFDVGLVDNIVRWVKHLRLKGYKPENPLFPRSKTEQGNFIMGFEPSIEVIPAFWAKTGVVCNILNKRSIQAGLKYFHPNSYRHFAILTCLKYCRTGEHLKAISQNFGHEDVATTLSVYANFDYYKMFEILESITFYGEVKNTDRMHEELLAEIQKAIKAIDNKD